MYTGLCGKLEGWHVANMMEVDSWTWMWLIESQGLMRGSLHFEEMDYKI